MVMQRTKAPKKVVVPREVRTKKEDFTYTEKVLDVVEQPLKEPDDIEKPIVNIHPIDAVAIKKTWRKVGGGAFIMGNRMIKPNQLFTATEAEIPRAFRNTVVEVSTPYIDPGVASNGKSSAFTLKENALNKDLFDIYDVNGKRINEVSLPLVKANQLKIDLEK